MRTLSIPLLGTLLFAPALAMHAADFVVVAPDVPPAPIIVFQDAPPRTRDAAVTLAEYIEKIGGRKPAIIDGEPQPLPGRAIWVGVQPVVKSLFPNMDLDFTCPEETLIAANGQHLIIAGRDRWDPEHMEAKGRLAMKTGRQQEYGTANAVYTFLQDQLGVRWLWPGEEDVVPCERIAIPPCEVRYHPQIRARSGMFTKLSLGDNKEGPDEVWARLQRVQLDSLELLGGHGFGHWWDDIPKKYTPELLAEAESHLDAAAQQLAGADQKYRRRLAFIRCGLDYTKLVVDTRTWMQKFEAGQGTDTEARAQVLANWQRVETMKREFPPFAINWQAVFRVPAPGGEAKRIMGLHPDTPLSGRVLRELRAAGLE